MCLPVEQDGVRLNHIGTRLKLHNPLQQLEFTFFGTWSSGTGVSAFFKRKSISSGLEISDDYFSANGSDV